MHLAQFLEGGGIFPSITMTFYTKVWKPKRIISSRKVSIPDCLIKTGTELLSKFCPQEITDFSMTDLELSP